MSTVNVEALLEGLAHKQGIAVIVLSIFLTITLLFILGSLVWFRYLCNKRCEATAKAYATVEELSLYEEKRDKMFKRFADRKLMQRRMLTSRFIEWILHAGVLFYYFAWRLDILLGLKEHTFKGASSC